MQDNADSRKNPSSGSEGISKHQNAGMRDSFGQWLPGAIQKQYGTG